MRLAQTVRTVSEQETTQKETKKKSNENPISRQTSRNRRVRDFADTERAKKNIKHIKKRHRYGQYYIARGKGGIQTVAEDEVYHLDQYGDTNMAEGERRDGVLVRPRHRTTDVAICVSRAHLHGLR